MDNRILNEGRIEEYHRQIDAVITERVGEPGVDLGAHPRHGPSHHQLYRCLKILADAGMPLQCDEIEARSVSLDGTRIRHNNANKVLKAVPALAIRLDPPAEHGAAQDADKVRYEITSRGITYVRSIEDRGERFSSQDANG